MNSKPAADSTHETLWRSFGIDSDFLTQSANWLEEDRGLHGKAWNHFSVAASLIRFSSQDYKLASAAFFHAVLGLERALKLHYKSDDGHLQELLMKSFGDGLISDALWGEVPAFRTEFDQMIARKIKKRPASRTELLVQLIPRLRNDYMHGEYLLAPDFLHLTLQVRTITDQLATHLK